MNESSVKAIFKCPDQYKQQFKESRCSLTISVDQPNHEGEKLYSTIKAINKNFKSCNVMLCDTLQRHNIAIFSSDSEKNLYQASFEAGNLWLKRNQDILDKLTIEYSITRWDEWIGHSNFDREKNKMVHLYQNNRLFKVAMNNTIDEFVNRVIKRNQDLSSHQDFIFQCSFNYLIEECAVQSLWIYSDYEFEIYPSKRNLILTFCYEKFIQPFYPNLLRPVSIKFKKISSTIKDKVYEVSLI